MASLQLDTRDGRLHFHPGEVLSGTARWDLSKPPAFVEVRLLWFTRGKGTEDIGNVDNIRFENPTAADRRSFSFKLPEAPYSFTGQLVSLVWALELVAKPRQDFERLEITVAPGDRAVELPAVTLLRTA